MWSTPNVRAQRVTKLFFGFDNSITDFSPLAKFTNLRILYFSRIRVTDLTAISQLPELILLDMTGVQMTSLEPLKKATKLSFYVSNSQ